VKDRAIFSVYKSSAGSGKTYTLVREYIVMALQSPRYFKHILAITFTNKAANEMKQRIVLGLTHLALPKEYENSATIRFMLPDLAKATGLNASEISTRASSALEMIIHEYDDFAVRTIDSFVSRIIRTFAHDLHLPVDFEIEMDSDMLLEEATEELIAQVGTNKELTEVLVEYTRSKQDDEKSWRIDKEIAKTGKILFNEDSYQFLNQLKSITPEITQSAVAKLRKLRKEFALQLENKAIAALRLIDENGIDYSSFFQGSKGIVAYFKKLAAGTIVDVTSYAKATVEEDKWFGGKISSEQRSLVEQIKPELQKLSEECFTLSKEGMQQYVLLGLIQQNIYQVGMLSALENEIDIIKRDKRILHISEFNKRITDIILKEPVPFIYERTGERYFNYLIDEFQDTSELQWKNLLPLLGDSLSVGHYNLIVGDGKQAIYRFRNGKVEQFMYLPGLPASFEPEIFGDTSRAMVEYYEHHVLQSNFRSQAEIIRFNNEFFAFAAGILGESHKAVYEKHEQEIPKNRYGGYVSIDFLPYESKAGFIEATLTRVHELILQIRADGFSLGDIALLTRTNKDGNELASFMLANGIPVVSTEALLLAGSPEVNFLVAMLSYLTNSENQIAGVTIFNFLKNRGVLNEELLELVNKTGISSFSKILNNVGIEFIEHKLLSLSLYDLCEELIRLFDLNAGYYNVYLQFFMDFVNKVAVSKGTHLLDFLEAWDLKKEKLSVVVPEGMDAVRILSIHKSKGLEFPIVIWPMATSRFKATSSSLWVNLPNELLPNFPVALLNTNKSMLDTEFAEPYNNEQNLSLLDHLNVMYVACTRPAERLYIISREQKAVENSIEVQHLLYRFIETKANTWQTTEMGFTRGNATPEIRFVGEQKDNSSILDSFISTNWQERIKIARLSSDFLQTELSGDKKKWGNIIHETLSLITIATEIDRVVESQTKNYGLSKEEASFLTARVVNTVTHSLLNPYFSSGWELKSEKAMLSVSGAVYRPDRVMLKNKSAVVIEFKTGVASPTHTQQLQLYASLLVDMGYLVEKKYLVYIDEEIAIHEI